VEQQQHRATYPHDTTIFLQGDAGDTAYLIERGQVEISTESGGRKLVLAILQQGDLFGEMALIDNSSRSATAAALGDVELSVISHDYLYSKMGRADPLINLLLRVILQRFRHTIGTNNSLTHPAEEHEDIFSSLRENAIQQLKMVHELQRAIEQQELELYYQPIVSIRNGYIAGFEALVRWNHPERGMVPPDQFIGLAEESGLIVPLGLWVLREACRTHREFQARFTACHPDMPSLYMSINASGRQFDSPHFLDDIRATLEQSGVEPSEIKIEITETMLMDNPQQAVEQLQEIKALNLQLALDDFGTGYSSLSYLHQFPIDTLKIDRAFVSTMLNDKRCMAIIDSLVNLAHNLGMDIIAEGIEEHPEFEVLRDAECEYGQGYLFSRPLPRDDAYALLEQGKIAYN